MAGLYEHVIGGRGTHFKSWDEFTEKEKRQCFTSIGAGEFILWVKYETLEETELMLEKYFNERRDSRNSN